MDYAWDREKVDELFGNLQQKRAAAERIGLLEQVAALIKGPYLGNLDAEWAIPEQLKYQESYRHAMLELAALYLKDGRTEDCLSTARQALQSDPLLEGAHRLIIQAYATLHNPAAMTLQYRQYEQALDEALGLQPSSELSNLYEELLDVI
jgi:DNA-binding SARP family transcriptional activator